MPETKLVHNPSGGFLMQTPTDRYHINEFGVFKTEQEITDDMEVAPFDIVVQASIDNAKQRSIVALSTGEIGVLQSFVGHLIQTFQ